MRYLAIATDFDGVVASHGRPSGAAKAMGQPLVWPDGLGYQKGMAVAWFQRHGDAPFSMQILPGRAERIRHLRKYAEGSMRDHSFFFRGPDNRHNLRAQNLAIFAQIAEGDRRRNLDVSLAPRRLLPLVSRRSEGPPHGRTTERIEQRQSLHSVESRRLIRNLIEVRYTLPE